MKVASLWRHPIKSHGREAVDAVTLTAGQSMPWDRTWAVAHNAAKLEQDTWASCRNFIRVAAAPQLAAITAEVDEEAGKITLRHPTRPDLTFDPDAQPGALIGWASPLMPEGRAAPVDVVRLQDRGWTDSAFPSVSIANHASHRAVEQRVGHPLSIHRWRANIWFDGAPLWEEFDWVGRDVQIGDAVLRVAEPAERCMTTAANPETGRRDTDTLGALDTFGHRDFSVLAEVVQTGRVAVGDGISLL